MDIEPNNETETDENQDHIIYRYENAKDNEYQPKQYESVEVSQSGGEILKNINSIADDLDSIIDKNDLKIISKYEDLSEEELKKLLEEKNENLLKLNNQKEELKNKLNTLLKELNKTITDNAHILYKEKPNPELIFNLQKEIENKKKELKTVKNINHSYKCQYNAMNNKLNLKKNNSNDKDIGEEQINNIKKENKKLQLNIRKYKDDSVSKKIEIKKITDNIVFPNMIKHKSDEIRNLTNSKHEYYTKITMSIKSLENIIKEISYLEELSQKKFKEEGDEKLNKKINYWINLIKSDLTGTEEEMVAKIEKNESNFIKEINKLESKNNIINNNINNSANINMTIHNNRVKSSSMDENKIEKNYNIGRNTYLNISLKKNRINNNTLNSIHKGIFGKYNYLKQKQVPSYSLINNRYKYKKLNRSNFSSEEIKINRYNNKEDKLDIDDIIQKDYEDTTENEYRELLDKKAQYVETNMRLENNIKEIEKTKKFKIMSISYTVMENGKKLQKLKSQNEILEKEIINFQNLYQLAKDKEKLKQEIKEKEKNNNIIENNNKDKQKQIVTINKLESSLATENMILNELKESNDSNKNKNNIIHKNKKMIKNKNVSGYVDDFVQDKSIIEAREERIQKIKEKYLFENGNEEINEYQLNEDINNNDINFNNEYNYNDNLIYGKDKDKINNIINKYNEDENNINNNINNEKLTYNYEIINNGNEENENIDKDEKNQNELNEENLNEV